MSDENWDVKRREDYARIEFKEIPNRIRSLPDYYFDSSVNRIKYNENGCAPYPKFSDLYFENQYWQTLETGNGM